MPATMLNDTQRALGHATQDRIDLDAMLRTAITNAHTGKMLTPNEALVLVGTLSGIIDAILETEVTGVEYPGHTLHASIAETGWCAECGACPRHGAVGMANLRCTCPHDVVSTTRTLRAGQDTVR
jgi:hypothetical protein